MVNSLYGNKERVMSRAQDVLELLTLNEGL